MARKTTGLMIMAGTVITAERIAQSFWPVFVSFVLSIAALYLPFGDSLRAILSALLLIISAYFLWRGFNLFSLPSKTDVQRRLEEDSAIRHRPLSSENDTTALLKNRATQFLWIKHHTDQERNKTLIKPVKPSPILAKRDPFALRFAALAFIVIVIIIANGASPQGFAYNIPRPAWLASLNAAPIITITPPEYTQIKPFILTDETAIKIPQGATLNALIKTRLGTPRLELNDTSIDFKKTDANLYSLSLPIPQEAENFTLHQWLRKAKTWDYTIIPDKPPVLSRNGDIEISPDGMIRVPMIAYDDYGIETLLVRMNIDQSAIDIAVPPVGESTLETRSLITKAQEPLEFAPVFDYTSHPWAGLPVTLKIMGTDHANQSDDINTIHLILPEKTFSHPIAKDLIFIRKKLAWNTTTTDIAVLKRLLVYLNNPDKFGHDIVVFLGLRTAASRLNWSPPSKERSAALIDLLWDLAVRIEDGNLSVARQTLRTAQNTLDNLMRDPDAKQDEISRAMNEMRQAMQNYLNELSRELQKDGAPMLPPDAFANVISPDSLNDFMQEMEQALRNGDTDKARDMMAELQDMMDKMQSGAMAQMPPDMQMMQRGKNELKELVDKQQALRDQTARQAGQFESSFGKILPFDQNTMSDLGMNNMPPVPAAPPSLPDQSVNTQANKTEQEALRYILGQLMMDAADVLDEIPETMGLAEQEMRGSSDALGGNDPAASLPHQDQAIAYLKDAQQQLSQQLKQRMKQMGAMGLSQGGSGMKFDPLGRPYSEGDENGNGFGSNVEIPSEAERKRAYEILKELRDRSADRTRSREELDYYERLLQQY